MDGPNAPAEIKVQDRVRNVIDWARKDENLSYAEIIGILEMIKLDLHAEALDEEE